MVNVVLVADTVVEPDHGLDDLQQIELGQGTGFEVNLILAQAQPLIQLVAAHLRQVVAARIEQHRGEQTLGVIQRRRVAGAQAAVQLDDRFFLGALVDAATEFGALLINQALVLVGVPGASRLHRLAGLVLEAQHFLLDLVASLAEGRRVGGLHRVLVNSGL